MFFRCQGYTRGEIAEMEDKSLSAVRQLSTRALKRAGFESVKETQRLLIGGEDGSDATAPPE